MMKAPLSPRQHECLTHLANGLTVGETARRLGLSRYTVRDYLREAADRLDANTIGHALALAVDAGLVKPNRPLQVIVLGPNTKEVVGRGAARLS
ncbi:MAG: LuxR C-terminal-related transcriptional regulator [Ardenticatenaceae bacterium]|nr:LuxR C-terminal-related transcriptional regulator [Ardenticatenaceae bacterium]HBY92767.1 hypothetical protein [Chloroflexota bacterium]